jgi:hypothetical protein
MGFLRSIVLLEFAAVLAFGQAAPEIKPASLPNQPGELVRSLYAQAVARHPHDIPAGADWEMFSPYFSKALLQRIDLAKTCSADWDRQNPYPPLKAAMASGYNLFSGDRGGDPAAFDVEKTESEKNGSFRVTVSLTRRLPAPVRGPGTWWRS